VTSTSEALVRSPDNYRGLTLLVSPKEALEQLKELQAFVDEVMVEGIDYGKIPGVKKPSLWQPGAQKLAEIYGLVHEFHDILSTEDWDRPFFFYRRRCILKSRRDGTAVGDGIGSCNSKEDRYAWRWLWPNDVPKGTNLEGVRRRTIRKKGGGEWVLHRFPNDDLFSLVNTIDKMASKRSYVHAVTAVTRSAGIFTQDAEDLPEDARGAAEGSGGVWEDEEDRDSGGGGGTQRGPEAGQEKVSAFLSAIAAAKDDEACKTVGRDMVVAHKAGQISDKQRLAIQDVIGARREALTAKAKPEGA
jgi:hypothetical protein